MKRYVILRVGWAIMTTLFLVASSIFFIFFVLPGGAGRKGPGGVSSVAVLLAGRNARLADMRAVERELGLDQPIAVQYARYIGRLARGDLGFSYAAGAPVKHVILPAVPASLSIAVGASFVWVTAGIAVGVISAHGRGSWGDRAAMAAALAALSIPVFVVALMGLAFLLRLTGIYAGNRYVPLTENPIAWFEAMWLPWICLAFPLIAVYARMVRSSVVGVQGEDYIRTSWAKGLRKKQVVRHELRGSLTPVLTMYGLDFGLLLGGSIIIETIFRIPGLGSLLLGSRAFYDFPVMAGIVLLFSVAIVVANLTVDLLYGVLDPRVTVDATIAGGFTA